MRKLNLGCGRDYKKGWVNVDANRSVKADLYFDVSKKFPLKDNSFDYILAQDLLEHLTKEQAEKFLEECYRVLKPGGVLEIRVPNLFDIFKRFRKDPEVLFKFVYGDTSSHPIFGLHKYGYTEETLRKTLARAGFKTLFIKKETTNFVCKAKKIKLKIYPIKLLISGLDSGGIGGAENFLVNLAKSFPKEKVKVSFLTVKRSPFEKFVKEKRFPYFSFPFRNDITGDWKGLLKFFLFLPITVFLTLKAFREIKRQNYDVLLISGFSDKIILTPIAKLFKIKVIWIEFASLEFAFKKFFYLPKILYRLVKDLPDFVIVPTRYTKNKIIPQTRISEAKIKIIPCGIPLLSEKQRKKYFQNAKKLKEKLRLKGFVIGQVSRLQKEKGQELLIKAFKKVIKKHKNATLVIVGEGGEKKNLKQMTEKLKLKEKIKFLGFWPDVYEILACFDLFVFPSYWQAEGFGLAPLEALILRIPVLTFDQPPMNEVLEGKAIFVEKGVDSLAKGIFEFIEAKKTFNRREASIKEYDIKRIARDYLSLLEKLKKETETEKFDWRKNF